ncbi:TKL protein kinase [Thecamonas trahens ATCC 50062]|uniref:TKL protein kinase n=1 Tax=Thecamonas trahens ATCC 50062 TaxID=461836 RepID=A0A0L0DUU6_THETB|nr:TKL protein kinase [Thecamonas trahens ATCC 50062]KNC55846.1 TKL protein kinase [Thecamonas trahens ATCC 50062]|eukprot:XP_013752772.1 TKL protein kinase [Thecamonas trahens ATCC 50062]
MAVNPTMHTQRFTSSTSKTKHTYVRVVPKPVLVTLSFAEPGEDTWVEHCTGSASAKYVPGLRMYGVCMKPVDAELAPVRLAVSPHVVFSVAEGSHDLQWLDVASSRKMKLSFPNKAALEHVHSIVKRAQNVGQRLDDPSAMAMWYSCFGTDSSVTWPRFFKLYSSSVPPESVPTHSGFEDQLKAFLINDKGSVTLDTFAGFLLWFGPYEASLGRWAAITSMPAFNGGISREQAEELLRGKPPLAYLIRLSDPGFFSVSYNYQAPETGTVEPQHFRIENVGEEGFTIETVEEELVTQVSIAAVVQSQSHILGEPVSQMPFSMPSEDDSLDSASSDVLGSSRSSASRPASGAGAGGSAGGAGDDRGDDGRAGKGKEVSEGEEAREPVVFTSVEFGEDGWVDKMGVMVGATDSEEVRIHAGNLMVSWVEDPGNKAAFVTGGGLALLRQLAETAQGNVEIERLAVRALCALAGENANKVAIVEQMLPTLYQHAVSPDEQVQQYSAFIFANLVLNDPQIQQVLVEQGCLPALAALTASDSSYVQANVAWVFGNLAQHEANKKIILLGGLQALFKLAQSDNAKVKKYAFDALGCLGIVDGDDVGKLIAQVKQSLDPKPVWEINYSDIKDMVLVDSGGYGNVYLGKYLHMKVAVKRLKKSQLRDLEAFKLEISMMSKLRHPNIVLFLGATTSPLTIVTEYMARKSMFDVIHDPHCSLEPRRVLRMIKDSALGMNYLHSLNIIHRDFKSLNLLVDEGYNVKITDFGLSRVLSKDSTATPHGTYAWRPPEMFRSEKYDHKVDVYSFGIVLWELITRRIPFDSMSYEAIKRAVLEGVRPEVPSTNDPIIHEIIELMKACWQADPVIRPGFDVICEGLNELSKLVRAARRG